ncbi:hypothetical protein ACHQM5_024414 [Ranunculus cassubicifolius]
MASKPKTRRFLSTSSTFQVSTFVGIFSIVYMRTFLVDSSSQMDETTPLLTNTKDTESNTKMKINKKIPSLKDIIHLLCTSLTFTQAAVIAFFSSLAEGGLHASLLVLPCSLSIRPIYIRIDLVILFL